MFDPAYEMAEQARWERKQDLAMLQQAKDHLLCLTRSGAPEAQLAPARIRVEFWEMAVNVDEHIMAQGGLTPT